MDKFSNILKLSGIMVVFVTLADGVLGIFGYELTLSGSAIPNFEWPYLLFMAAIDGLLWFWCWRKEQKKT